MGAFAQTAQVMRFEAFPALHTHGSCEEKEIIDSRAPPFLGWKGTGEAGEKVVQPYKAHMRLAAKRFPAQIWKSIVRRLPAPSPKSGEVPERSGGEGAYAGIHQKWGQSIHGYRNHGILKPGEF